VKASAVNGSAVQGMRDVAFDLLDAMSARGEADLEVRGRDGAAREARLVVADAEARRHLTEPSELLRGLGFQFWPPVPAVLGQVVADGPAARAGLAAGDEIVSVDGAPRYNWRVSTARRGYITPPGTYHPEMLARHWFSRKYYNSPMPHSIFFYGGFAIHGSYEISHLGRPASHGCVRLDPGNAAILFGLVQHEGMGATTIVIH